MKLLVWNIRQGGGRRRESIVDAINAHSPDIVALLEFVPRTSESFLQKFRALGFAYQIASTPNGFDHAICVVSKVAISTTPSGIPTLDDSGLWLEIAAPAYGVNFGFLHAPTHRAKMKAFLDALIRVGSVKSNVPFLFAGDFNTGIGPADGPLINYGDVDRFRVLQATGFVDAWRHHHKDLAEFTYTWRTGKSYRIDHVLASAELLPRIRECHYSHSEREHGLSDHSAIWVEIDT